MSSNKNQTAAATQNVQIEWDDSKMRSDYANVCNAASSGEEISLFFGVNRTWQPTDDRMVVELRERLVLNPGTAKRLQHLLARVLEDHEVRFGPIESASQSQGSTSVASPALPVS